MSEQTNTPVLTIPELEVGGMGNVTPAVAEMPALNIDNIPFKYGVRIVALALLGVLGLFENIYVLRHLYKLVVKPNYKLTRLETLVLLLTATNFLIVTTQIPQDISWHITVEWLGGAVLCKVTLYAKMFLDLFSTFLILSLSVDRCLNLSFPLTQRVSNPFKLKFLAIGSVLIAAIAASPQAVVYNQEPIPGLEGHFQCTSMVSISTKGGRDAYNIFVAVLHFCVPLIVTIACYLCIVVQLTVKAHNQNRHRPLSSGIGKSEKSKTRTDVNVQMLKIEEPEPISQLNLPDTTPVEAEEVKTRSGKGGASVKKGKNKEQTILVSNSGDVLPKARNRMLLMTVTVTLLMILTITPYYVTLCFLSLNPDFIMTDWVMELIQVLQYSHCVTDPLCYWYFALKKVNSRAQQKEQKKSSNAPKTAVTRLSARTDGSPGYLSIKRPESADALTVTGSSFNRGTSNAGGELLVCQVEVCQEEQQV